MGYAVGALAIVEAADLVLPRLGAPESIVTGVLIIGLLGFPIAVALAWAYELTPDGLVRTSPSDAVGRSVPYAAGIGALVVVATIGVWLVLGRGPGPRPLDDPMTTVPRSLAVLPFEDLSATGDQEWFGEGVAEEILAGLTKVPGLRVVARESSFSMRTSPLPEIAEQLGATHVLSGSVRTDGTRARIRAQLTHIDDQSEVWSRDFRPELTDVLGTQEAIAQAVVDALEVELGVIETPAIMATSTRDPVAYEHYLRGLRLWNRRSEAEVLSSIDHFRAAVDSDPEYAAAWAGLAYAHLVLPEYSPTANVRLARDQSAEAAAQALALDPDQPDALTAMGWGRMIHHYDWEGAEGLITRALEGDPTNVNALHWQSHVFSWRGRPSEAVDLARRATDVDPLSSVMRQNLAFILMEAREYDAALLEAERVLASDPSFAPSLQLRWNVHTRAGRIEAAAEALEAWLIATGRDAVAARELAIAFAGAASDFRRSGLAGSLPATLMDGLRPGLEMSGQLHAAVGDTTSTLEILERGLRERAGARSLLSVRVNPLYDFLRGDPRFSSLVERVGLGG